MTPVLVGETERSETPRLSHRVTRFLGIQHGEGALAWWAIAFFAVSQASQGLGLNAADTLFFLRFGVEFLPLMILVSGPIVMVGMFTYAAGLGRVGSHRWLPGALMGLGSLLILERIGITVGLPGIYPVVWLGGQVVMLLSFTAMWTVGGEVCTTRQAKRLYPLFASAGIAGGVIGNAATGPLAGALGTENLLLVQTGLLVVAATLARSMSRRFFRSASTRSGESVFADLRAGLVVTMGSPLLKILAWVGVAFGVLFFLVVFPFSEVVTESFESEADVAGFLGFFSAIATATTFLVSLLAANRLFARLGVVVTLMIVPLIYVGGFALWLASFNLFAVTLVRGLQFVSVNALGGTAWSSLFNVLPPRRRGQVMAFMAAGPAQLGTMVSGALLLASTALPGQASTLVGLAVAVGAAALVWRMRGAYSDALVAAVERGFVEVFTAPTAGMQKPALDADARRAMSAGLDDPRAEARVMAVSMLDRIGGEEADRLLRDALRDDEPRVRAVALDALTGRDAKWLDYAEDLLADPVPDIRRRTLALIWEGDLPPHPAATVALDDPVPEVRAMAAVVVGGEGATHVVDSLLRSPEVESITAGLSAASLRPDLVDEDLTRFLDHPDRLVRAAAAPAVARRLGKADRLRPLLDDSSILTRRSAAFALADTSEGRETLFDVLQDPGGSVRACDSALRALTESGRAVGGLAAWASQEITRAAYLRRHRRSLEEAASSSVAAGYLVRLLEAREERLQRWAIMALTTEETKAAMATVMRGIWSEDLETRSQALEALDSLADRSIVRELLELLEEDSPDASLPRRASLGELCSDLDYWIRALAFRCLREELTNDLDRVRSAASQDPSPLVRVALSGWSLPTMQETETLDVMERVLALQRVPVFSEIDPEDLERIALVTTERQFEADERIFSEGDEGEEMLVMIRGEVVISREIEGVTTPIRTYGPGNHVGELALLRRRPRASDVTAGPEGVHVLALRSAEFQAILEERPEVAMAMLGTLAERLATM